MIVGHAASAVCRRVAPLAAIAIAIAACGGGDDTANDEGDAELAAAITASLEAQDDQGFADVFDTTCMGVEVVDALGGAENAESEYGVTAAAIDADGRLIDQLDIDEAAAEEIVDGFDNCGDLDELLTTSFVAAGATEELAGCVVDELPEGLMRRTVVENYQAIEDGPATVELQSALEEAAASCGAT